jgi:hypothetical protein
MSESLEQILDDKSWNYVALFITESERGAITGIKYAVFFCKRPNIVQLNELLNEMLTTDLHKNAWDKVDDRHEWMLDICRRTERLESLLSIPGIKFKPTKI